MISTIFLTLSWNVISRHIVTVKRDLKNNRYRETRFENLALTISKIEKNVFTGSNRPFLSLPWGVIGQIIASQTVDRPNYDNYRYREARLAKLSLSWSEIWKFNVIVIWPKKIIVIVISVKKIVVIVIQYPPFDTLLPGQTTKPGHYTFELQWES